MKVIITGVAGLIGSRTATWIHDNIPNCQVIGVDDLSGGYVENVDPRIHFYRDWETDRKSTRLNSSH